MIGRKAIHLGGDRDRSVAINPDLFSDAEWEVFAHYCRSRGMTMGRFIAAILRAILDGDLSIDYDVRITSKGDAL